MNEHTQGRECSWEKSAQNSGDLDRLNRDGRVVINTPILFKTQIFWTVETLCKRKLKDYAL